MKSELDAFSSPRMGILCSHNSYNFTFDKLDLFSSPCLGILFHNQKNPLGAHRLHPVFVPMHGDSFSREEEMKLWEISKLFSSPCMGILFSQQAWEPPPAGLSIALLRRGFPIDLDSHVFLPLTFCFLRFHAYRRGFTLLEFSLSIPAGGGSL